MRAGSKSVGATAATGIFSSPNTSPLGGGGLTSGPPLWAVITNGASGTVFLGGTTGVTGSSNGFGLPVSTTVSFSLQPWENIYAITSSGTASISYLISGA